MSMKPRDSNSLLRALAEGAPGDHPDADLLTGFAEGSLLAREREAVMAHLAGCAECREVLSLSAVELEQTHEFELVAAAPSMAAPAMMPAAASAPAPIKRKGPRVLRVWLPWAAVAASIAVVSVVALRFAYNKPEQIALAPQAPKTVAVNAPPVTSEPAPPTASVSERRETQREAEKKTRTAPALALEQVAPQFAVSRKAAIAARQSSAPQTSALEQTTTQNLIVSADSIRAQNAPQTQEKGAPEESAQMALHGQASQPAPFAPPAATGGPRGLAPALAGSFAKSANAGLVTRPHWRINDDGHLERAFGDGAWQAVAIGDHARLHVVSTIGSAVWAGGENDALYRSPDEGATWQTVQLPPKNGAGQILIHIRFDDASTGTIEASGGTTWSTTDGGATWK
jgi:hypothetical protein